MIESGMIGKINLFRERLRNGPVLIGPILDFDGWQMIRGLRNSPQVDFLWIDLEHGAIDANAVYKAIDTLLPTSILPLVRATGTDSLTIKKTVDLGPAGIILPHVDTVEQAAEAVNNCLYPPMGSRSIGPNFAANQWMSSNQDYLKKYNENMLIVAQIEHVDALKELDGICSLDRIDVIFIGRYDLSASIGRTGELDHPELLEMERKICETARAKGKAVGTIATQQDIFERTLKERYDMILLTSLMNFVNIGISSFLKNSGFESFY